MKFFAIIPKEWIGQFLPSVIKGNKSVFRHRLTPLLEIQSKRDSQSQVFGVHSKILFAVDLAENRAGNRYETKSKLILFPSSTEVLSTYQLEIETRKGKFFYCDRPQIPLVVIPYKIHEETFDFLILWGSLEQN